MKQIDLAAAQPAADKIAIEVGSVMRSFGRRISKRWADILALQSRGRQWWEEAYHLIKYMDEIKVEDKSTQALIDKFIMAVGMAIKASMISSSKDPVLQKRAANLTDKANSLLRSL